MVAAAAVQADRRRSDRGRGLAVLRCWWATCFARPPTLAVLLTVAVLVLNEAPPVLDRDVRAVRCVRIWCCDIPLR